MLRGIKKEQKKIIMSQTLSFVFVFEYQKEKLWKLFPRTSILISWMKSV